MASIPSGWYQSASGSVRVPGMSGFVPRGTAVQIVEVAKRVNLAYFLEAGDATAKSILKKLGDAVVADMKQIQSQWSDTGRLENSIHTSTPNEDHFDDMDRAESSDLENAVEDQIVTERGVFVLVAGSWLPYACVAVAGRRQDFINPAIDTMAGSTEMTAALAFDAARENGL